MSFWEISVLVVIAGSGLQACCKSPKPSASWEAAFLRSRRTQEHKRESSCRGGRQRDSCKPGGAHDNDLKAIETAISNFERNEADRFCQILTKRRFRFPASRFSCQNRRSATDCTDFTEIFVKSVQSVADLF